MHKAHPQTEPVTTANEVLPICNQVTEITVQYKNPLKPSEMPQIKSSIQLEETFRPFFSDCMEHHEEFYIMLLNRANRCLGVSKISQGGQSETVVDNRIVFQIALKGNASAIALCHNHPSGNLNTSCSDDKLTDKIKHGCSIFGLQLLDHIILSPDFYYSYADEGRL
jgi:DNA repair protein RadC